MKKILFMVLFLLYFGMLNLFAQLRSFNEIFPGISQDIRNPVFSGIPYVRSYQRSNGIDLISSSSMLDHQIANVVLYKNPGYLVESISLVRAESGNAALLNVYNALRNIRDLKGLLYDSHSRGQPTELFEEATRIAGERQTTPIPDPPPSTALPSRETVFVRLKDINFGNSFYRAEMFLIQNGLCYSLTNFRSLNYLLMPVIKEGNFIAQMYFEPIQEGILIYGIAGAEVSDFVAGRIHMNSAIAKRLDVIITWASNGILNPR